VQRTRRALREALVSLILERGWDAVGVLHVCERADVGRSTFYLHFADKEELLVSGFDDLREALRQQLAQRPGGDRPLAFVRGMVDHAAEQQRLFRAVVGKRSGQVVERRFRELVIGLVEEDLALLAPAGPRRDAAARYVAGAFLELLRWWLDTRTGLEPADLEELFDRLTAPVLAALPGWAAGGGRRRA
jgi:AcrR family transcriptional regulator